jgi:hypothetical protein
MGGVLGLVSNPWTSSGIMMNCSWPGRTRHVRPHHLVGGLSSALEIMGCRCGGLSTHKSSHYSCLPVAWITGESQSPDQNLNVFKIVLCKFNLGTSFWSSWAGISLSPVYPTMSRLNCLQECWKMINYLFFSSNFSFSFLKDKGRF